MSKITTVYSAIVTKLGEVYTGRNRLINPYELTDNAEIMTRNAWGLKVLSASRQEQDFCDLSIERTFSFILVRQFPSVSSKANDFDAISISLLEDQHLFLDEFWNPAMIGQIENISKIDFSSISGINFLISDEKKFLYTEIEFTVTINESI